VKGIRENSRELIHRAVLGFILNSRGGKIYLGVLSKLFEISNFLPGFGLWRPKQKPLGGVCLSYGSGLAEHHE
jgi:hypothetical protein